VSLPHIHHLTFTLSTLSTLLHIEPSAHEKPYIKMYQGLLLTLISGLFFSSQALAAAMPQSSTPTTTFPPPGLTCPATYTNAPLIADCEAALKQITAGPAPQICTDIFTVEKPIKTVGTCTVQTYSSRGKAHCLAGDNIRAGVRVIIDSCKSTVFTQGSYTWTQDPNRDGVRLIKTA